MKMFGASTFSQYIFNTLELVCYVCVCDAYGRDTGYHWSRLHKRRTIQSVAASVNVLCIRVSVQCVMVWDCRSALGWRTLNQTTIIECNVLRSISIFVVNHCVATAPPKPFQQLQHWWMLSSWAIDVPRQSTRHRYLDAFHTYALIIFGHRSKSTTHWWH